MPASADRSKPIALYYWPTPNGWKITIMLEECGVPYEIKFVDINKGEQFDPDFLKIAPNNRMPAIIDPDGPGGQPISIFESGAVLQYLGNKFGKFYPSSQRERSEVEQWLYWQMANLGPYSGQAGHFRNYARENLPYAINRYTNEVERLYHIMNKRLADRQFLAGDYSIADMACYPWTISHARLGQKLEDFPNLKRWYDEIAARPAVMRALKVGEEKRKSAPNLKDDDKAHAILFGARKWG